MAVYCGVCAIRIGSAADNEGSFQVSDEFAGWDYLRDKPCIRDTCETCATALREVVTKAANAIVKQNLKRVQALADRVCADREAEEEAKRMEEEDRRAFAEWKRMRNT